MKSLLTAGFLSGHRTIIIAITGIIAGWLSHWTGAEVLGVSALDAESAWFITYNGLIAIFLRKGLTTETNTARLAPPK